MILWLPVLLLMTEMFYYKSRKEIVRTKLYEDKHNTQSSSGTYSLSKEGDLSGKITIISEGSQYNQKRYYKIFPQKKKHIINGIE
jgi:hypothetical protein